MDDDVITAARALATLVVESGYYWWGGSVGVRTYCRYCGTHHEYRHSVACPLACAIVALLGDVRPDEFHPAALHCKVPPKPPEHRRAACRRRARGHLCIVEQGVDAEQVEQRVDAEQGAIFGGFVGPDELDDAEFSTWTPNAVALTPVLYEDEPDAGT